MAAPVPLSPDLQNLLEECKVGNDVLDRLRAMGCNTIRRFSILEDDRPSMRRMVKDEWGLAAPEHRGTVLAVLDGWEQAVRRAAVEREEEAHSKQLRQPQPLTQRAYLDLR